MFEEVRKVWALLPTVLADARASMVHYWWLIAAAVVCSCAQSALTTQTPASGVLTTGHLVGACIGLTALVVQMWYWFGVYSRAIQLAEPAFRMDVGTAFSIVGYSLAIGLIGAVCCIPGIVAALDFHQVAIAIVLIAAASIFMGGRFVFVLYAIEFDPSPIAFSWRLTRGWVFAGVVSAVFSVDAVAFGSSFLLTSFASGPALIPFKAVATLITCVAVVLIACWSVRMMMLYAEPLSRRRGSEATVAAPDGASS